jgi:hypothetical protein
MAKKKSKRKKKPQQRPPGYDPNERRRQRLEEKRLQREAAAKAQRRAEFRERLVRGMVFAAVIVAVLWFFFWPRTPDEINGNPIREFRADRGHTNDPVGYESVPPTTGDHSPSVASCGIHATQIPDELFVHALEHGAVGVLYDPQEVEVDTIRDIEAKVGEYEDRTISAPYSGTDTPITVTSWTKLMRLDSYDADTVTEYIEAFRGTGPEDNPCENTQDAPFDPASLEPTPAPSPSPDDGEGGGNNNDGGKNKGNKGGDNQRRDRDSEDS